MAWEAFPQCPSQVRLPFWRSAACCCSAFDASGLTKTYLDFVDRTLVKADAAAVTGLARQAGGQTLDVRKREEGWQIVNVDATVVAQQPRIGPHVAAMRERLGAVLGIALDAVSVKATTTDHLGAIGRTEGIAAQAVALVVRA